MGDYRSLVVWRRARRLVMTTYAVTKTFPRSEFFGLVSQMRGAAVSIAANLAEGCGRDTDREIARFARISLGSASELEYYFQLAGDLGYLPAPERIKLKAEIGAIKPMLAKLADSLTGPRRLTTDD